MKTRRNRRNRRNTKKFRGGMQQQQLQGRAADPGDIEMMPPGTNAEAQPTTSGVAKRRRAFNMGQPSGDMTATDVGEQLQILEDGGSEPKLEMRDSDLVPESGKKPSKSSQKWTSRLRGFGRGLGNTGSRAFGKLRRLGKSKKYGAPKTEDPQAYIPEVQFAQPIDGNQENSPEGPSTVAESAAGRPELTRQDANIKELGSEETSTSTEGSESHCGKSAKLALRVFDGLNNGKIDPAQANKLIEKNATEGTGATVTALGGRRSYIAKSAIMGGKRKKSKSKRTRRRSRKTKRNKRKLKKRISRKK